MFLLTKNTKERVVTAGVVIALGLILLFSIECGFGGRYALIFSLLGVAIAAAIFKGIKLGYIAGGFLFGGLALIIPSGVINPFCYMDMLAAKAAYAPLVYESLLAAALCWFLFYSLAEHARLRYMPRESFRLASWRVLFWVAFGLMAISILGMMPFMFAGR